MALYKCKDCGVTCISKCVGQRNIFIQGELSLYTSFISTRVKPLPDTNGADVILSVQQVYDEDDKKLLERFIETIRQMPQSAVKVIACGRHDWGLMDKTCDLRCCERL